MSLALPGVQLDDDVTDGVLPALGDGIFGHLVLGQANGAKARLGGLDVAGSDALDEDLLITVRSLEGKLQTRCGKLGDMDVSSADGGQEGGQYGMGLTMGSRLSTPLRKETERKGENLLGAMMDSG